MKTIVSLVLTSLFFSSVVYGGKDDIDYNDYVIEQKFNILTMGHSFLRHPSDAHTDLVAQTEGNKKFFQHTVGCGGSNGAPEWLWDNGVCENEFDARTEIMEILATGNVDLFIMSYHDEWSSHRGYLKWIHEALKHNQDTVFAFSIPHQSHPCNWTDATKSLEEMYNFDVNSVQPGIQNLVDIIKEDSNIEITFFEIPTGYVVTTMVTALYDEDHPLHDKISARVNFSDKTHSINNDWCASEADDIEGIFFDGHGHTSGFATMVGGFLMGHYIFNDPIPVLPENMDADKELANDIATFVFDEYTDSLYQRNKSDALKSPFSWDDLD